MAQTRFTSQFQSEIEGGPWTSVAIWSPNDPLGPINGDIFEVGEPVLLCWRAWSNVSNDPLTKRIVWIHGFAETINGHSVNVGATRDQQTKQTSVGHLIKLEPLHRIAAEGISGPATL
jgi:hypothetical protein